MPITYRELMTDDLGRPGVLHFGGARMTLLDVEGGFWALRRQMEALVGRRLTDSVLQQAGANGGASFARAFVSGVPLPAPAEAVRDCVAAYQAAGFGRFEIETLEWPVGHVVVRGSDTFEAWMAVRHGQACEGPTCAYTSGVFVGLANVLDGRRDVVCVERACQAEGAEACVFELLSAPVAGSARATGLNPDPLFSRQVNLLEVLFDRAPMGIAVFDRDLVLRRSNPTWAEYVGRYTPTPVGQVMPGACLLDLIPGSEASLLPVFRRALTGEEVRCEGFRSESGGMVSYWDIALTPVTEDGDVIGIVDVMTDATERVLAREDLEQHVAHRTRALSALYDVMAAASESLDLPTVLSRSLERVLDVIGSEVGAIHLLEEEGQVLRLAASRGVSRDIQSQIESVLVARGLAGVALAGGEPLVVPLLAASARPLLALPAASSHAYLGVPIRSRGTPIGVLSVVRDAGQSFDEANISLLTSIAGGVGVAVENAQLYQKAEQLAVVRERERLSRELHDSVTQSLYSLTLLSEAGRRWAERGELGRVEEYLERVGEIGQQALREMRLLVYELRPLVLRREGLAGAIQQRLDAVEKRAGVDAKLLVHGQSDIPMALEEELYKIAQEALNNALKHAVASSVIVRICAEGERVTLRVEDNGRGFDPDSVHDGGGLGLTSMRQRAEKIGGTMTVTSRQGEGTTLEVCVKRQVGGAGF